MLNFYHRESDLPKSDEEVYSSWYEYYKINRDTLSDIHHLLVKFENFLVLFDRICEPSDEGI